LYFTEYLGDWCTGNDRRGNYPCNNYIFTLYEKNDHGRSGGNKTVIDVRFDVLNVSQMKMNEMAFETYW
ncbi:MAG: hypothetical protein FWC41_05215, partial [Firmicutes bacterium]|nr:hypothetical protein [Bacillota bacterium]